MSKNSRFLWCSCSPIINVHSHLKEDIPTSDKIIKTHAPNSTALRLPIFVTAIVCTFSVRVEEPVPVPQRPAKTPQSPSRPIPLLTTPGVGGLDATNKDDAWYEPTCKVWRKTISHKDSTTYSLSFKDQWRFVHYEMQLNFFFYDGWWK